MRTPRADVAINYASSEARAQQVIAQIEALGRKGLAVQGDVADPATAKDFVAKAVEALGGVDVFVSNAGICPFHALLDMPVEVVDRTFR
jgi:L-rhamnose 1-dehydrogenase